MCAGEEWWVGKDLRAGVGWLVCGGGGRALLCNSLSILFSASRPTGTIHGTIALRLVFRSAPSVRSRLARFAVSVYAPSSSRIRLGLFGPSASSTPTSLSLFGFFLAYTSGVTLLSPLSPNFRLFGNTFLFL